LIPDTVTTANNPTSANIPAGVSAGSCAGATTTGAFTVTEHCVNASSDGNQEGGVSTVYLDDIIPCRGSLW